MKQLTIAQIGKQDEMRINKDIVIKYLGRKKDEVRLGVIAPRSVKVIRAELKQK